MTDTLIKVEGVAKKFCRSLKKSLWYGLQDLGQELRGHQHGARGELRQDEFWAVQDVNFELKRGECLGLIGRNGAGKTTLLRMLNGLIKPDQGRIEIRGRIAALIALNAGFNPILTGRENIYVNAAILGLSKHEAAGKIDEIVDFSELAEFIDSPVQNYSSGMQVRLGFSVATALRPDVLLLDEILAVGDSAFRTKCFNRIQEIIRECAVIFVSHNMPQVTRISSRLMLMHSGACLACGPDLGAIIAEYHNLSQADAYVPSSEGTSRAAIKSFSLLDGKREPSLELAHGEAFTIVLTIEIHRDVHELAPRLLITFADQDDANVAQVYEPLNLNAAEEYYRVTLDFSCNYFNAGRYSITASILLGPHGELAHVIRHVACFTVSHTHVAYAPVILHPSSLSVLPAA